MAGILGKIFGSGDVIKSGIDLIDSFHTSTEEEIAAKTKAKVDIMGAYAPFKLAQRVIAFSFTFTYLVCFAMVLGFTLMDRVADADKVQRVLEDFQIGWAMIVILGFYFGAGAAEGFMDKKKKVMEDLKLPVALVAAMAVQLAGGVWWVSQQAATIANLEEIVGEIGSRMAIEDNVNLTRDVQSNAEEIEDVWDDIDEMWDEIANLANSIGKVTALQQRVALIENDLKYINRDHNGIMDMKGGME